MLENIHECAKWIPREEPAHAPTLIDGSVLNRKSGIHRTGDRCIDVVDLDREICRMLSPKEALILDLLVARPGQYGLELVAASKRRLKRGTVYVTLGRMEDKGYIRSRLEDAPERAGGLPRRIYSPTPLGRSVYKAWISVARHLKLEFAR